MSAKATREFAVRDILIAHCGETLSPDKVDQIASEIVEAMENSSTAWAFQAPESGEGK